MVVETILLMEEKPMAHQQPTTENGWPTLDNPHPPSECSKAMHRAASTPDLGQYNAYYKGSSQSQGESTHENDNSDDSSFPPLSPSKPTAPRRVPSFKDAILLNAQEISKEEEKQKELAEKIRKEKRAKPRTKPRLVIKPIKRCIKSTGDLQSLTQIEEHHDDYAEGGGGGGGCIAEEGGHQEILGETDAMDFYHRKAKGFSNRKNGLRERPDEAKRKEISVYKRDMQRQRQQQQQGQKQKKSG
mmetsp:Transcript_11293/g.16821  ORF Transcript_11293/g.16821 Transcript_11293/m.16821 type:complete len:244 (-) Transcript_11293:917-1648(-)